jgi:DNA polymerase-3 subunit gamma/tau
VAFARSLLPGSKLPTETTTEVVRVSNEKKPRAVEKAVSTTTPANTQPAEVKMEAPTEPGESAESELPEVPTEEASGSVSISTQDVLAAWTQIRSEVKSRRSQAEALLNSQRLVQMKNGTLILGFPSDMLKSKMENPENIEVTKRVINNLLHIEIPIQCIVVTSKGGGAAVDTEVDPDGLVSTAINLGGKLIHKD